jgi:oligopeptide/dipeptide ABC transporter ATP-binding protein
MYLGKFVEQADRFTLFKNPLHPYTKALISAVPSSNPEINSMQNRTILKGDPPSPIDIPAGCRFANRCPIAVDKCHQIEPDFRSVGENHRVACHLIDENGGQVAG